MFFVLELIVSFLLVFSFNFINNFVKEMIFWMLVVVFKKMGKDRFLFLRVVGFWIEMSIFGLLFW